MICVFTFRLLQDGCLEEQLLVLQSLKELANIVNPVQSSLVFVTHALIQICRDENILKVSGFLYPDLCNSMGQRSSSSNESPIASNIRTYFNDDETDVF